MITRRQALMFGALAPMVAGFPFAGRASGGVRIETGPAFGSAWRLVLPDTADAGRAREAVEAIVRRIDGRLSPFRATSELAQFNAAAMNPGMTEVSLSGETCVVLEAALQLARASGGAFDPTVAPIGRRFGFGPTDIAATRPACRYQDLRLTGRTLSALQPGLSLDLCGIAKGYALDEMVRALDGLDFLLELGGEIAARGRHPTGRPWRMGIERPGSAKLQRIIDSDGFVLATSGDARQGYWVGGRRYSHVIDPRAASPVDNGVAAVSVLAPSGQLADGLATAAMVLGPDAAHDLLAAFDARALFLVRVGSGPAPDTLREIDIRGFLRKQPS